MGNCDSETVSGELPQQNVAVRHKFNPFFEVNSQQSNEHVVLSKYKFVSNYEDKFLGRCNVLEGRDDGNLYLSKDLVFYSEQECGEAYLKFKKIKEREAETEEVLRIKEIFTKKVDGFFTDGNKIIILVEYPLTSLKKEFNNRLINKLEFRRDQITNILYSAITGHAAIERVGSLNDKVRMAHVFVGVHSKQSLIKVIDSNLLSGPSNSKCLKDYGPQSPDHYDVCVAPEQFNAYIASSSESGTSPTSGVFSLGILVLNLCLMEPAHPFYHFHNKTIDKNQLKSLISIAGKRHGQNIEKFLLQMTEIDPTKRPSFTQIQSKIPRVFSQITGDKALRLSVVQDGNTEYIKNQNKSLRDSRVSNSSGRSRSRSRSPSRMFTSSIQVDKPEDEQLQNIHQEYTNGNQYMGQKKNGLKHGKGKYIFKDRSYYEGTWKNNQMNGKGELYLSNGKIEYIGEWKQGEQSGWGIMYSYDTEDKPSVWSKYQGEFKKGEMQGRGKLYFVNGTLYEGEMRGGKIFGKGRRIQSNGNVVQKEWGLQTIEEFISRGGDSFFYNVGA